MGYESVKYKNGKFEMDNEIISWVQKFMILTISKIRHPKWFINSYEFIDGNFHMPHGKGFFLKQEINDNKEKFDYCIKMIDLTMEKMEELNKRTFFEFIEEGIKGSWCEVNDSNVWGKNYQKWLDDDPDFYDDFCKIVLENLKKIMLENAPN